MSAVDVTRVAERALLVRFDDTDLARAVARAHALRERWSRGGSRHEAILGAGSLLVRLDAASSPAELDQARRQLEREAAQAEGEPSRSPATLHEIDVEFGGNAGPDLAAVAATTGQAERAVVERLCESDLVVAFIGFSPGFPYLIGLPKALEIPRLPSPRPRVPAGSVAIAGPFAGIYPSATAGGWRLLGRSDVRLFDPGATPPARLAPGDRVRLVAR